MKLNKRLEAATRMNVTSKWGSSLYQVTNYGLGGLVEAHVDPKGYHEGIEAIGEFAMYKTNGDIMATWMAWIGDEPLGGATAFVRPNYEVTVWPTKGSAAFWFSLDKKGFRDVRTVHGGCPVFSGSKWILNRWIYYYDQHKNYPCGLHQDEKQKAFQGHY